MAAKNKFCDTVKVWDDSTMSGHAKTYTSGYRRVNRQRYKQRSDDCGESDFVELGKPPPIGECIKLVKKSLTCPMSMLFQFFLAETLATNSYAWRLIFAYYGGVTTAPRNKSSQEL